MNILRLYLLGVFLTVGCAQMDEAPIEFKNRARTSDRVSRASNTKSIRDPEILALLDSAEAQAAPLGRAILKRARTMVQDGTIVRGSCWDYIHAVYNAEGVSVRQRKVLLQGKKAGPYADLEQVQAGDWLYYLNLSYGMIEHSGIFVAWTNRAANEALMVSYVGGNRSVPGRYAVYDLSRTYHLMRPQAAE